MPKFSKSGRRRRYKVRQIINGQNEQAPPNGISRFAMAVTVFTLAGLGGVALVGSLVQRAPHQEQSLPVLPQLHLPSQFQQPLVPQVKRVSPLEETKTVE
jgi:hypothetical protein